MEESILVSKNRFKRLVEQAPVAIGELTGPDFIIQSANKMLLHLWQKDEQVIGLPLRTAVPDLLSSSLLGILSKVYSSGVSYYSVESKANLEHHGSLKPCYFNIAYHPLKNDDKEVNGIMLVASEVTDLIHERTDREKAEEMLRFAIEAANVGTWLIDLERTKLNMSGRSKALFGFYEVEDVSFQHILNRLPVEFQHKLTEAIRSAVKEAALINLEFPVTGYHDQKLRWVRVIGRRNEDKAGKTANLSGVMIEFTEQKQDELRKNDFISIVSHELKTPLTSLKGYTQVLLARAGMANDHFGITALTKVETQVNKMATLISGFLNVSRLESGKIHLVLEDFTLNDLISDTVDEASLLSSYHQLNIVPCDEVRVFADRDKIGQVISNFLSNALKYSSRGSQIKISCSVKHSEVQVNVTDEGIGIKSKDLEKLFDRFYRVENKFTEHISGFGIGLYLCSEIVGRHNGKIGVSSEIGKGSTFWFSLPIAKKTT